VTKEAGREFFKLDAAKKTVFVFGGSLGAASINNAMLNILDELQANDIQLIWQTGQTDYERVRAAVRIKKNIWLGAFIDQIEHAYAAADVVVCRSGALTIAELTKVGLPAILVPYPHAAADHQTVNARSLVDAGAAVMMRDSEVKSKLQAELFNLLNDEQRRTSMSQASKQLGKPEAGKEIAKKILDLVE
ncbi:MAG TPA: glycosyltransferase, partial [Bacteroidota bacterium]